MIPITSVLAAEHKMFCGLFDHIQKELPKLKNLAEAKHLARLVEGLLRNHAKAEEDLFLHVRPLAAEDRKRRRNVHQEHHEIDVQLRLVSGAKRLSGARALLKSAMAASRKHFAEEERFAFVFLEKQVEPETLQKLGAVWLLRHHCPYHWTL